MTPPSEPVIKTVAINGAAGNLGVFIVQSLLASGFNVTAISREGSDHDHVFPAGVTVKKVDFNSKDSIVAALVGQDAMVSVIGTMAVGQQKILVDAAVEAGVRRFIPSEYGLNTRTVGTGKLGRMLRYKIATVDYLMEKAKENESLSWTGLGTNLFFDWSMKKGFLGFDMAKKKATIVDSGNEKWSTTNLEQIGRAVAAILEMPEKTKNQFLMVSSFTTSQNDLLKALEEETSVSWTVERITSADCEKLGDDNMAAGNAYNAFWDYVRQYQFADGADHALKPEGSANQLLGLETTDLKDSVRKVLNAA